MAAITVNNLYKIFGKNPEKAIPMLKDGKSKSDILDETGLTVAIDNASFEVKEKEIFVIMGLSGSGKSTVLRCLNRLIEPTAGEIYLESEKMNIMDIKRDKLLKVRRQSMSMVFQNFGLFPHRSVLNNVAYGLEIGGMEKEERHNKARNAISLVGLKGYEDKRPSELSGGMQQRVGLARALANDPEILLMDEAFSALDPLIRTDMQDELLELQSEMSKTIVFITHDLDEALKLGDRIAIMKDGHIDQIGTAEEILTNPATKYVKEFVQDVDRTKVITAENIMKKPIDRAFVKDTPRVAVRKMRKAGIDSILVTDRDRTLHGLVTIEDALKLVEEGKQDLSSIIDKDIKKVYRDTSIMDILPLHIDYNHPVAVVDEENKLLGIIVKVSVLSGIIGEVD